MFLILHVAKIHCRLSIVQYLDYGIIPLIFLIPKLYESPSVKEERDMFCAGSVRKLFSAEV
jgi:hypothetical protein